MHNAPSWRSSSPYTDGVDQTGMLIADNGQSARRSRPYTLNQYFASMRVNESKYTWAIERFQKEGLRQAAGAGAVVWASDEKAFNGRPRTATRSRVVRGAGSC